MPEDDITVGDCLQGAFAALLRGDTDERDKLCNLAQIGFGDEKTVLTTKSIFDKKGTKQ